MNAANAEAYAKEFSSLYESEEKRINMRKERERGEAAVIGLR